MNGGVRSGWRLLWALLVGLVASAAWGDEQQTVAAVRAPLVSLIIDDLGDRYDYGSRAIELPGQLTYAILPQTTYSHRLAEMAHDRGKEVMLHQPMQAINGKAMGPGGMGMEMSHNALLATLEANLASVPHARGVNNHMGSLLTRHPGHMAWLMEALRQRGGLYFVDSGTSSKSVAQQIALEHELPVMRRHVFLDHERDQRLISRQFMQLVRMAHRNGHAIGIGHPYPETLAVLEQQLPQLEGFGVRLVPVSQLIAHQEKRSEALWQASLSPSPRGVKSSKQ